MQISCTQCGAILKRKPSAVLDHNFCNRKCYNLWQSKHMQGERAERITVICDGCGKQFKVLPHRKGTAHYCSSECRKQRITQPCAWCNTPVERLKSQANKTEHAFCNHTCYGEWRKTLIGELSCHWKGGPVVLTCVQCHQIYKRKVHNVNRQGTRFCSRKCFAIWRSENMTGENNRNWKGGPIGDCYGPEWRAIREAIRQRDNYICQRCGLHQADHHKALDVHHVIPLREFLPDRIDEAHNPNNLITLCSSCHAAEDNLGT
jgi:5-methylcytosine-specific restriction endonuclease McrA